MDDQRIARLTREFGDQELAERLVGARKSLVHTVPEDVARRQLPTIVAASAAAAAAHERPDTRAIATVAADPRHGHAAPVLRVGGVRARGMLDTAVRRSARLLVAASAATILLTGGLAVTGSLPAAAQELVADAVSLVGFDLPRPALAPPAGRPDAVPGTPDSAPQGGEGAPGQARRDETPGADRRDAAPGADRLDDTPAAEQRNREPGDGTPVDADGSGPGGSGPAARTADGDRTATPPSPAPSDGVITPVLPTTPPPPPPAIPLPRPTEPVLPGTFQDVVPDRDRSTAGSDPVEPKADRAKVPERPGEDRPTAPDGPPDRPRPTDRLDR